MAIETPLVRVVVLKISAGIIHDIVPDAQKQKLKSHVLATMKAQCAASLVDVGGYTLSRAAPIMKASAQARFPPI